MSLELTLAYKPTGNQIKSIKDWFKDNFGQTVPLDIKVDKSLIAGMVVAYKGRIFDYSRAKIVEKLV